MIKKIVAALLITLSVFAMQEQEDRTLLLPKQHVVKKKIPSITINNAAGFALIKERIMHEPTAHIPLIYGKPAVVMQGIENLGINFPESQKNNLEIALGKFSLEELTRLIILIARADNEIIMNTLKELERVRNKSGHENV